MPLMYFMFALIVPSPHTVFTYQCEQNLVAKEGTIATPNFPRRYPPSLDCVWTITAAENHYIELTFLEFDVEPYHDCKTDALEVKDGGDKNSPLIGILVNYTDSPRRKGGQYCNQRRPPKVITSTHNELRLWFTSDSSIQLKGFKATYRTLRDEGCGGIISAAHGEIATPRFPLHYPRDRKCEWKIKVAKGKFVALKFLFFEMETTCLSGGTCKCLDSVSLKDGHSNDAKSLGTYCFSAPPPIVTSGNELTIKFDSDLYGRLQGFKAVFTQSSTERCGGDFILSNGTIESPMFNPASGSTYPSYSECVWTITGEQDEFISVRFIYMDVAMAPRGDCSEDFVEIRDGASSTSPLIGAFCNMFIPDTMTTTGNIMFLRFHSNGEKNGKGFQIAFRKHQKSCTNSLGMEDGRIPKSSLIASSIFKIAHKPHKLEPNLGRLNGKWAWCSTERQSKFQGEYFQINFKKFTKITKIATQGYTMYGNAYYVTRYKVLYTLGGNFQHYSDRRDTERGILYTLFDGNRHYNITKTNSFSPAIVVKQIQIVPLDYHSGKRKHVCMRVEVYGCEMDTGDDGKVLTKTVDEINFSSYKKTSNTWLVSPQVHIGNTVYIFEVVGYQADCGTSKLRLSTNGDDFTKNETYCGNDKKTHLIISKTAQQIWVQFDIYSLPATFQGVHFKYKVLDLGFGRVITSRHGVVKVFHQAMFSINRTSVWLFKLAKGNRISLEFERIRLPKGKHGAVLIVKAGLLEQSTVIRKLSGHQYPSAFVYSKNELRLEYHVGRQKARHSGEGFTLKYTAWQKRITSEDTTFEKTKR